VAGRSARVMGRAVRGHEGSGARLPPPSREEASPKTVLGASMHRAWAANSGRRDGGPGPSGEQRWKGAVHVHWVCGRRCAGLLGGYHLAAGIVPAPATALQHHDPVVAVARRWLIVVAGRRAVVASCLRIGREVLQLERVRRAEAELLLHLVDSAQRQSIQPVNRAPDQAAHARIDFAPFQLGDLPLRPFHIGSLQRRGSKATRAAAQDEDRGEDKHSGG
jgi:hypothetical protein